MATLVSGVAFLVHLFSIAYLEKDPSRSRFFAELSLFVFAMLGIVLADNLVSMFIFWELVGLSSYLLIGFWVEKPAAGAAANKAFLVNRVGDFGFILGILGAWALLGTVHFADFPARVIGVAPGWAVTAIGLGLFCGCLGKSAQFPLHVWLPDSMEGPTPVSSLLHAATMVVAGVYMLIRILPILELSQTTMMTIAWVGGLMTLFPALIACQQNDLKRILAYSTLSEIAYMVMAVGLDVPGSAMYHLTTHAFFKCLLFLAAGSVIHGCHEEQNIWKMGGLGAKMKWTFRSFAAGYLALIGAPLLSGFFSKDAILAAAWQKDGFVFLLALLTALLTAFYMTRLFVVVFLGQPRSYAAKYVHDGPPAMTVPLIILAVLSVFAGYGFIGEIALGAQLWENVHHIHQGEGVGAVMALAIGAFVIGTAGGWVLYKGQSKDPILIPLFKNKFYLDELYAALIAGTQDLLATMSAWFDKWILDGLFVRGLSGATWGSGFVLRFLQIGNLQAYAFLFGLGVVGLIYFLVFA